MSEVTMANLLQTIREIDRQGQFGLFPQLPFQLLQAQSLETYWRCLQRSLDELNRLRTLEEEYRKLQGALQRQETEIRKRISIEQQLKLYTEALKLQVEDLEKEKLHLLESSKAYIKELKASNQKLYADLSHAKRKPSREHTPSKKKGKGSPTKTQSHNKSKHDRSIREIIKTEHIERNHSSSQGKKHGKQANSTISGEVEVQENSKTFHVSSLHSQKKDKQKEKLNSYPSRKRNKYLFSNYTLLSYLENSNRHKQKDKAPPAKSPPKHGKEGKKTSKWKDKNRSSSVPKPNSNAKQTI